MRIAKSEIRQCGPVRLELELLVEARSEELHEFAKHLADLVDRGVPVTIEEGVEPWRSTSDEVKRLRAETDLRSLRNRIKDKALRIQTADLDRRNRRIEELKRQVSDLKVALELERDRVVKVDWATIDPYRCAPWEKTKAELEQENHQLAKAKNRALRQRDEVRGRVDRLREKVHKLEELLVEAGSDLCRARTELRQKTKHLSFDRWEGWENVRTLWAATSNLVARMRGAYYKGRTFEGQVQAVERALKATTWLR